MPSIPEYERSPAPFAVLNITGTADLVARVVYSRSRWFASQRDWQVRFAFVLGAHLAAADIVVWQISCSRSDSAISKHSFLWHTGLAPQSDEVGLLRLFARGVGLNTVNFLEQLLETHLIGFVLFALVELAKEVAAGGKGVVAELQGCETEVLALRVSMLARDS